MGGLLVLPILLLILTAQAGYIQHRLKITPKSLIFHFKNFKKNLRRFARSAFGLPCSVLENDFGHLNYFLSRATKSKEASTSIQGKATLYIDPHDNDSKEFN